MYRLSSYCVFILLIVNLIHQQSKAFDASRVGPVAGVTPYEYAMMANYVYGRDSLPPGWNQIIRKDSGICAVNVNDEIEFTVHFGYAAAAYKKGKTVVIAHKGTDWWNLYDLWEDRMRIMQIRLPRGYFEDAKKLANSVIEQVALSKEQLEIVAHTGHSLGGALAEFMAAAFDSQAVVFDTFGTKEIIRKYQKDFLLTPEQMENRIVTYNAAPNLINSWNRHLGPVIRLFPNFELSSIFNPASSKTFFYQQHGMREIVSQFNSATGNPFVSGNYSTKIWNEKWPFIGAADTLAEAGNSIQRSYIKNYNANPYYWELYFDSGYITKKKFATAQRVRYANKNLQGISEDYEREGIVISDFRDKKEGDSSRYQIWGGTNYADNITAGNADHDIWPFGGNNFIHDTGGKNTYKLLLHNMGGTTTIHDDNAKDARLFLVNIGCELAGAIYEKNSRNHNQYIFRPKNPVYKCNTKEGSGCAKWEVNKDGKCGREQEICYEHDAEVAILEYDQEKQQLRIVYNKDPSVITRKPGPVGGEIVIENFTKEQNFGITFGGGPIRPLLSSYPQDSFVIGTDERDILQCSSTSPSELFGFSGNDVYLFYYDSQYDCVLNGYPVSNKNFTIDQIGQLRAYSSHFGSVIIEGYKDGDLVDLSKLRLNFEDLKYDFFNSTTTIALPNNKEIRVPHSEYGVDLTLDGQTIINSRNNSDSYGISMLSVEDSLIDYLINNNDEESSKCAYMPVINVKSLNGENGFSIRSETESLAVNIASTGDVNGDGLGDVLVQTRDSRPSKVHVIYGSFKGFDPFLMVEELNGENGFTIEDDLGSSSDYVKIGIPGDVNGDGIDDIQIGTHGRNNIESYLIFGKEKFPALIKASELSSKEGFYIRSVHGGCETGKGYIGDINGDGFADIPLYGGDFGKGPPTNGVKMWFIYGRPEFPNNINVDDLNGQTGFKVKYSYVPNSTNGLNTAGDLNGDGIDDIYLGFSDGNVKQPAYVLFGTKTFPAVVDLENPGQQVILKMVSNYNNRGSFGFSGGTIGDFNNDGVDDLFIGSRDATIDAGNGFVIFGNKNLAGEFNIANLDGRNGFKMTGFPPNSQFGFSMSYAGRNGDYERDGFVVSAYGTNYNQGAVYVFHNQGQKQFTPVMDKRYSFNENNVSVIQGRKRGSSLGWHLHGWTDVNGDGMSDTSVSSLTTSTFDNGLYVVFGQQLCAEDKDKEQARLPDDPPEIKQENKVYAQKNQDGSLTWRCDPRYNNVFYLEQDKPFVAKRIEYKYGAIAWKAYGDSSPAYDTPCPNKHDYPYHILMGQLGDTLWSPCSTPSEASAPVKSQVKWAVQDDLYDDNRGYFDVTVMNYE